MKPALASMPSSGLYVGEVVHQRFAPRRHRLKYRIFQLAIDLDAAPTLAKQLKLFSYNGFNLFSLHDRDHGEGRVEPLRAHVERTLADGGVNTKIGRILLLAMPRVLGFVFNPLSVYYCYDRQGALAAMLYEVSNTFGERHSYLIPAEAAADTVRQSCDKDFFVSPFMDMDMRYEFSLSQPRERVAVRIWGRDLAGAPLIFASFAGERRDLTDAALVWAALNFPLMTLGVVAAIHWEALCIWLKGIGLRRRPPLPKKNVSVAPPR